VPEDLTYRACLQSSLLCARKGFHTAVWALKWAEMAVGSWVLKNQRELRALLMTL